MRLPATCERQASRIRARAVESVMTVKKQESKVIRLLDLPKDQHGACVLSF